MSKHCTYIFTSEGNNVIGFIKITVLRFTNEHLISSNSGRLSVYSYHLSTLKCVGHPRYRQVRSTQIIGDNKLTEGAEGRRRGGGVSRKNKRSNNSVKKKFEKGRKVPGLLKKQAKRPLKISFKPCDILTGASLGIFHLGSKPIAV